MTAATLPTSAAIETPQTRAYFKRLLTEEPTPIFEQVCAEYGWPAGVAS